MSRNKLMPTVVLSTICIIVVALLAIINIFTAPQIKENQEKKLQEALLEVMPDGVSFDKVADISALHESVTSAYRSASGGYVFEAKVKGYKTGLVIVCGVNADGKVTGAKFIKSSETLGAESVLGEKYIGTDISDYSSVEVISGATMTSNGYKSAIGAALESFKILTGGNE